MLIISAAGNYVKTVVWPARFRSTIAVGAVNIRCKPWTASSRGRAVDISAPGESVWRATVDAETETDANGMGKGTTFATGTTAGIAALWLAYHANDPRLAALKADGRLTAAFREGLRRAAWLPQDDSPIEPDDTLCADDAHLDPRRNGAGIINADALLAVDLDDLVTAGTRSADADELPITASIYPPGTPIQRVEEDYRRLFAVAGDEKLETVAYLEAELGYHYADSERVREAFDAIAIDGVRSETAFGRLREALRTSDLSPRFRRALQD
ncbi:MAG: S8 family serine peptidase [Pseudomonadota bacterium]